MIHTRSRFLRLSMTAGGWDGNAKKTSFAVGSVRKQIAQPFKIEKIVKLKTISGSPEPAKPGQNHGKLRSGH